MWVLWLDLISIEESKASCALLYLVLKAGKSNTSTRNTTSNSTFVSRVSLELLWDRLASWTLSRHLDWVVFSSWAPWKPFSAVPNKNGLRAEILALLLQERCWNQGNLLWRHTKLLAKLQLWTKWGVPWLEAKVRAKAGCYGCPGLS